MRMERVLSWAFSLCCTNSKAFCERPFELQRQQPVKDEQNVVVSPLQKYLLTPTAGFSFNLLPSFDVWAGFANLS